MRRNQVEPAVRAASPDPVSIAGLPFKSTTAPFLVKGRELYARDARDEIIEG